MEKLNFSSGGRMLHLDDLRILQDEVYKAIENQYLGLEPFIMSGCQVDQDDHGYKIASGLLYINGKLLEFAGASGLESLTGYFKEATPQARSFYQLRSGGQAPKRIRYEAEFVSGTLPADFNDDYLLINENGGKTYFDVIPHTLQQLTDKGAVTTNVFTAGGGVFNGDLMVNGRGRLGIGTSNPTNLLEIDLPTGSSQYHQGIQLKRADGYLLMASNTGDSNAFTPSVIGVSTADWKNAPGLSINGTPASDDVNQTAIILRGKKDDISLSHSPIVKIQNNATDLLTVGASGNIKASGTATFENQINLISNNGQSSLISFLEDGNSVGYIGRAADNPNDLSINSQTGNMKFFVEGEYPLRISKNEILIQKPLEVDNNLEVSGTGNFESDFTINGLVRINKRIVGGGEGSTALSIIENERNGNGAHFLSEGANNIALVFRRTEDGLETTRIGTSSHSYFNSPGVRLGIGTDSPTERLEIKNGNVKIEDGDLLVSGSAKFRDALFEDLLEIALPTGSNQYQKGVKITRGDGYLQIGTGTGDEFSAFSPTISGVSTADWNHAYGLIISGQPASDQVNQPGIILRGIKESNKLVNSPVLKIQNDTSDLFTVGPSGDIGISATSPISIHRDTPLFAGVSPKMEIRTGSTVDNYEECITLRHNGIGPDKMLRRLGLLMKLSSENTTGESHKMGGLVLESNAEWANSPSLYLVTANQKRLTISNSGNIGIGTTSPINPLEIISNQDDKGLRIGAAGKETVIALHISGNDYGYLKLGEGTHLRSGSDQSSYFEGNIISQKDIIAFSTSDKQHKTDIKPITSALEKIEHIGGYTFKWKNTQNTFEGTDIGVLAQEIEEILPINNVVTTRKDGFKAVKYEKITPLLIEGIKALKALQQQQEEKMQQLEGKLARYESQIPLLCQCYKNRKGNP
ncbi:tail fiber domain-containing protein [Xanthovirga aplysinae]|uniref:tail fiber domain-containing protein n=1 Tax=Xanthovirga aplysinae TaxID=2529853 RepID=UPI0012BC3EBD|nr:tail fiber domain-containing protein [Xanthovirga aplysinae]MTI30408.1 tail fiber domain-containing protein [Xanthovirga aplysinae]